MADDKYLYDTIRDKVFDYRLVPPQVPNYITENIRYDLYKWQEEALINFLTYQEIREVEEEVNPTHLLFNMATGTGKTLLMAALILYYYKQGKRHFIFFVNQNNIVGKTEDNLTDPTHNKYLFKKTIVIDEKTVNIQKVTNFSDDTDDIQILFTSIQKLHNDIHTVKEDSIFLEDLQKRDIIMLGDEAHHLNATTKKNGQKELDLKTELSDNASQADIEKSWENTVIKLILNKGKEKQDELNENALLEFTATVPTNKEVVKKYIDKTIYKFDLKDFLKAGYTKEINLVSSSFDKRKRILQALLFNWYRHKIALDYGLVNFKPVILFRSKFIDKSKENNSEEDFKYFIDLINNLSIKDFDFFEQEDEKELFDIKETYQKGKSRIIDIKQYIKEKNISIREIVEYLKYAFQERNCIITNSKAGTKTKEKTDEETERLLNSLEDKDNHIRAIFTVKRLTEGWDVLNLYDIVRLYEGRDEGKDQKGNRKAGQATVSEVQLIGRGVRYYPFPYKDKDPRKRKFDKELNHELRVLEEFYFHSDDDHRYIDELKRELKKQELLPEKETVIKKLQLKLDFEQSDFVEDLQLYVNEQDENPNRRKRTLEEIKKEFEFEYKIENLNIRETKVILDKKEDETRLISKSNDSKTIYKKLKDFDRHIIRKAINVQAKKDNSLLRFNKLKNELSISSVEDILKDEFLGEFPITLIIPKNIDDFSKIDNETKLNILIAFFGKVVSELKYISNPNIGTEFKAVKFKEYSDWKKEISVVEEPENEYLSKELSQKEWYALNGFYGTSEERNLIEFLKNVMGNFEAHYEKVYLLRNEEIYKIYDFEKGRGFMPDFLLFLKEKKKKLYYQVFIEPKGSQFKDASGGFKDSKEGWKEKFLEKITEKYGKKSVLKAEDKNYKLVGLPLYNKKTSKIFKEAVKENLTIELNER